MKVVGIIAAMDEELNHFKNLMEVSASKNILETNFYRGKIFDQQAVLVRCGIGKVNAACCTQALIDIYNVDYVINVGAAGAINNKINIGDIVVGKNLVQHDFDTSAFGDEIGTIPRMKKSAFDCEPALIKIINDFILENGLENKIHIGTIATGDKFISSMHDKDFIAKNFHAYCTEMEGAAIAQVCYLNKIPFAIIRSITDKSDDVATESYEQFVMEATLNSRSLVKYIVEGYKKNASYRN